MRTSGLQKRIACSILLLTGAVGWQASAQSLSRPGVRVVRNLALYGTVWPGDFNGDGKTDLAASDSPERVGNVIEIALGTGTGSFGAPIKTGFVGSVLAVGDFNGDRKLDVVAAGQAGAVYLLPGRGDGTLGAPVLVDGDSAVVFAVGADLDGDGRRDLIVGSDGPQPLVLYPGRGDLTFGPRIILPQSLAPADAIVADFDGDGRRDFAVALGDDRKVRVFINTGGLTFTNSDIVLDRNVTDVTAADLDHDGRIDLIASGAARGSEAVGENYVDGFAYVLSGRGDGMFGPPRKLPVARGAFSVVVGDFTRDGVLDIATANRSSVVFDDCRSPRKTWDSVSILAGKGDGTFDAAASFSIGDQSDVFADDRFRNSVRTLNTSDLNGDHATDLIASQGALLFNIPSVANRPPTVSAGPDRFLTQRFDVDLVAVASDPDQDLLTYTWTDSTPGSIQPPSGSLICWGVQSDGPHTFTVTVDDGHGHRASDSVVYTFGTTPQNPRITVTSPAVAQVVSTAAPFSVQWQVSDPGTVAIVRFDVAYSIDGLNWADIPGCVGLSPTTTHCDWANPGPPTELARIRVTTFTGGVLPIEAFSNRFSIRTPGLLPSTWAHQDVGNVAKAGSARLDGPVYTVSGSGADIWGTADEFHFAYRALPTQFEISAHVDSLTNVQPWTKAGLMVRTGLAPGAPEASIVVTPGHGVAFQRRTSAGAASVTTIGAAITAPVFLRLTGFNGEIRAYYRKNRTDQWTAFGAIALSGYTSAFVGLAVASHLDGTIATVKFSEVDSEPMPEWILESVGTSRASESTDGTLFSLGAIGADIWGTADTFAYLGAVVQDDSTITARVLSIDDTSPWAKAGISYRQGAFGNAAHVSVFVTPGKGINLQYRAVAGGQSFSAGTIPGTAPGWARLTRVGDTVSGFWSKDGVTFVPVGSVNVVLGGTITGALAVTSHNTSALAEGRFDLFEIVR